MLESTEDVKKNRHMFSFSQITTGKEDRRDVFFAL